MYNIRRPNLLSHAGRSCLSHTSRTVTDGVSVEWCLVGKNQSTRRETRLTANCPPQNPTRNYVRLWHVSYWRLCIFCM